MPRTIALLVLASACADPVPPSDLPIDPIDPGPVRCEQVGDHLDCIYHTVGSLELHADVHAAPGDDVRPALLWIHGGALIIGHRNEIGELREQLDLYLSRGYVVVSIDYRLAPETPLDSIHQDVAAAWAWLRAHAAELGVDPDRIGVVGHSAGGYLALSSGFRLAPRPRAVVSFYGYGDITGSWYTEPSPVYLEDDVVAESDPDLAALRGGEPLANSPLPELDRRLKFYVYCRQTGRWPLEVSGRDPHAEPDWFADYEAAQNVGHDFPPTILLHGQNDDDVPFAQSVTMHALLSEAGVPVSFVNDALPEFAGAEFYHGFDEDLGAPHVRAAFDRVLDFLDLHVAAR